MDLYPPKGLTLEQFARIIRPLAKTTALRGFGRYPSFIHVDVRPSTRLIVWSGTRVWAEIP